VALTLLTGLLPVRAARGQAASQPARAREPEVKAAGAILVDAQSGQVLFERNADVRRAPASTTKIMTAVLLIEELPLDEMVEADKEVAETDGSSLYMTPGERISARDLLYALLLRSANDACVAVAKAITGSEASFAELMNEKAKAIGTTSTHFTNPNGLPDARHYSTARDLSKIACHAARLPVFNQVVATKFRLISRATGNEPRMLRNHSKFLWYYAGADGIKTGYTVAAGRCFVGSATRNGWRLISVVLNSPDMYGETARLLDYGFSAFEPLVLIEHGRPMGTVSVRGGLESVVGATSGSAVRTIVSRGTPAVVSFRRKTRRISAPVRRGATIGEATAYVNGASVATVQLVANRDVPVLPPARAAGRLAWRFAVTMLAVMVFWHVASRPQGTGRRWDRVTTGMRDFDAFRARDRQRSQGNRAGR